MKSYTVLIVDDNISDREGIRDLVDWESLGLKVVGLASHGLEGVEKARSLKPDLILTDIAMPHLDGIQMTDQVKLQLPNTRFVFMSCYDEFDYAKDAIRLGVGAYVLKPIDLNELAAALQKTRDQLALEEDKARIQEELRQRIRANLPVLREQFIRDLIYGQLRSSHEIEVRLEALEIPRSEGLLLLWFQIDHRNNFAQNPQVTGDAIEDKFVHIYIVKENAEQLILQTVRGYTLILDNHNLCMLLFGDWVNQEDAFADILENCSHCIAIVWEQYGIQITCGMSDLKRRLEDAPRMFQAAEYAVKSKFFGAGERIILAAEVKRFDEGCDYQFATLKSEVEAILNQLPPDGLQGVRVLLEKYYPAGVHFSEATLRSLCYSIINAVQLSLSERNESLGKILGNEMSIWEKPLKLETLAGIKGWLEETFLTILKYLQARHSSRYRHIVSDIQRIIDEQYSKLENIEQIVAPLYISASHANAIFKQETGKTIFEYLVERRMETARCLLADPYCRIYEVSEKVGYVSKSYFTSAFKNYTGLTPKQFRDQSTNAGA